MEHSSEKWKGCSFVQGFKQDEHVNLIEIFTYKKKRGGIPKHIRITIANNNSYKPEYRPMEQNQEGSLY